MFHRLSVHLVTKGKDAECSVGGYAGQQATAVKACELEHSSSMRFVERTTAWEESRLGWHDVSEDDGGI